MKDIVCIRIYINKPEADMAKSILEGSGIDAVVAADDCVGLRPYMWVGPGIRLLVKKEDAQKAKEILNISD